MDSDASYITDFDNSDADDDSRSSCRSSDSVVTSVRRRPNPKPRPSTTTTTNATATAQHVREFGEFEETHGWLRCRSNTYPERLYYLNPRSRCKTWCRPISRYVHVPLVSVKKVRVYDSCTQMGRGGIYIYIYIASLFYYTFCATLFFLYYTFYAYGEVGRRSISIRPERFDPPGRFKV